MRPPKRDRAPAGAWWERGAASAVPAGTRTAPKSRLAAMRETADQGRIKKVAKVCAVRGNVSTVAVGQDDDDGMM